MGSSDASVCPDTDDEEQVSQMKDKEEDEQGIILCMVFQAILR